MCASWANALVDVFRLRAIHTKLQSLATMLYLCAVISLGHTMEKLLDHKLTDTHEVVSQDGP